ncbi:hypothetical protein Hypma_003847 [Hypsizygus marmoreus]|uniref:Uncharacterized protein n=1 Tax=Hypsizygus marmoreus TaxID=39966 RepID=A0A369K999_HYPMA|nr:hypothetical protein Hypma_003847 [Hypsizygus marmoreus]
MDRWLFMRRGMQDLSWQVTALLSLSVLIDKEREETIPPIGDTSKSSALQSQSHASFDINGAVEDHTRLLRAFLQSHVQNISSLLDALPREGAADILPQNGNNPPYTLSEQFNMQVVVSTFTASLIISFISLVQSILLDDNRIPFDIGMLLSFFAMNVHFGNIIVAGRGAALTAQHAADEDKDHHNLEYFHHYLEICEQLQFFATVLFLVAIVVYTFFIFSEIVFPLVLLGVSIVGSLIVFWSAYWRVSMTFRNLKFVIRRVRGLHFRSKAYLGRRSS